DQQEAMHRRRRALDDPSHWKRPPARVDVPPDIERFVVHDDDNFGGSDFSERSEHAIDQRAARHGDQGLGRSAGFAQALAPPRRSSAAAAHTKIAGSGLLTPTRCESTTTERYGE